MKVLVLYREKSEHRQSVEELIRQFKSRFPEAKVEIVDIDGREGIATASLYDITRYPSILALRSDGSLLQSWEGEDELPRIDDIAAYTTPEI